jgi:hypothetical protein
MGKRDRKLVKEYEVKREKQRAGFVTGYDTEVEVWQAWCTSANTSESRRATYSDMRAAGFKPARRK